MKEKDYRISLLLDFYGSMLTDRQRDVIDYYYNEDLSLQEISEHVEITRQGVWDLIKRGTDVLNQLESRLGLYARFSAAREQLREASAVIAEAKRINEHKLFSRELSERLAAAERLIGDINL